ncbi:hypothetical protein LQJ99_30645 [Bacillus cereus]|nr:hypothetical protein [Bacillus cereus]
MIVLGIGLSVLLIAFLFIQVYPFHEQKLEQRKYDEYGIWIIICTGACLYISHHFLQDFQLDVLENNAYMIFNTKSSHSRKNDASNSLVTDFKRTVNTFGIKKGCVSYLSFKVV